MQQAADVFGWIRRGGRLAVSWSPRDLVLAGFHVYVGISGGVVTPCLCLALGIRGGMEHLVVIPWAKYIVTGVFVHAAGCCWGCSGAAAGLSLSAIGVLAVCFLYTFHIFFMRIAVTSPGAVPVFKAVARGVEVVEAPMVQLVENPLDAAAVAVALERCDAVVFATGRAAYRLAEEAKRAGLYEKIRSLVARMKVATVEGEKGAVMVLNAFGVRPAAVASTVEEFRLEGCRCAVVFHYGTRDEELLARVGCSYVEFFPYRALPGDPDSVAKVLSSDAAVFTSALAVRYFAEVGGPEAVKELAKKLVVAGGPGVSRALTQLGVPHVVAPGGRLGPLAQYVMNLVKEKTTSNQRPGT